MIGVSFRIDSDKKTKTNLCKMGPYTIVINGVITLKHGLKNGYGPPLKTNMTLEKVPFSIGSIHLHSCWIFQPVSYIPGVITPYKLEDKKNPICGKPSPPLSRREIGMGRRSDSCYIRFGDTNG